MYASINWVISASDNDLSFVRQQTIDRTNDDLSENFTIRNKLQWNYYQATAVLVKEMRLECHLQYGGLFIPAVAC